MYLSGEVHILQLHAITGQPNEKPQPKIITSMDLKNIFYYWYGYNKEIFLSINHSFSNLSLQYFFKIISSMFSISSFAIYYILLSVLLVLYSRKNHFSQQNFLSFYTYFVKIGMGYAFIGFAYALMKFTVNMPRPYCSLELGSFITLIDFDSERCLSSFPSAHTAVVILISYALWPFSKCLTRIGLVLTCLLVMLSRVVLAMHYPADILYSVVIAFGLIYLANLFYRLFEKNLIQYIGIWFYMHLHPKICP